MKDRQYKMIPLDAIKVINSRERDEEQFKENVRSIEQVGLIKPVLVNSRFFERTGKYELVCGEGRCIAHRRLGKTEIEAEVINCDRKRAYLISLVENIARVPPGTMWYAREMKRMRDAGMPHDQIAKITGKCETYVIDYIGLVEKGEERLIKGVEAGIFPMTFATKVAASTDGSIQNILMDAFDSGLINSTNLGRVRSLLEKRKRKRRADATEERGNRSVKTFQYTVAQLRRDITRVTREKEKFVQEMSQKENRLFFLLESVKTLRSEAPFMELLRGEGIEDIPKLHGNYAV
jgi:ParB family chromosome partitioning protein